MLFTRYFTISPRAEFIQCVAQVDADGAEFLRESQVWSTDYSVRAVPGNIDTVLSAKVKLGYLLDFAGSYVLGSSQETAFKNVLIKRTGWPRLSIESFDRNWELSYTDEGVIPLDECRQSIANALKSATLQLPTTLGPREMEFLEDWIGTFTKWQLP